MSKFNLRSILISTFLILIGGVTIFFKDYSYSLVFIVLGLLGIIYMFYSYKKDIKPFEKGWTIFYAIYLISFIIITETIRYFFISKFSLVQIIPGLIMTIILLLYFYFVEINYKKMKVIPSKSKKKQIGLFLILIGLIFFVYSIIHLIKDYTPVDIFVIDLTIITAGIVIFFCGYK